MDLAEAIEERRGADGGFGPVAGAASEPEATAMVAIALDDADAGRWLVSSQAPDGSVGLRAGPVFRDLTAVAALAMRDAAAVARAIAWLLGSQARNEPDTPAVPHDPTLRGWSWTPDTFGWVEPTAWAVLALRSTAQEGPALQDGIAVLRDRACTVGGWNYGNREVLDEELPPYIQTTALALLAVHGVDDPIVDRGLAWLSAAWPDEADGLLSLGTATAALRRYGSRQAEPAARRLRSAIAAIEDADTVALAWAAIALRDDPPFPEDP